MIVRSEDARYAKSLFYASYNDVDVFVEDTAEESKKIYVEILSRVFEKKLSIDQVFPVGPKPTVIKRCRADQGDRPRPAVYIVDGDYDVLFNVDLPKLKRLYRLDRYCIENYLIDPKAVIDVAVDEDIRLDEKQVQAKFDFDGWTKKIAGPLEKVVVALAVSCKKQCGLPTVKIDMARIQGAHFDHVDPAKVDSFEKEYEKAVDVQFGSGAFRELASALEQRPAKVDFFRAYASGKSLLMPLLLCRLKRRLGLEVEYRKLRVKLARRCDVSDLDDIKGCVG